MFERYVFKDGKKLRCGYTTGSCATASAKASAFMLLSGNIPNYVGIVTPDGTNLKLEVINSELGKGYAKCGIVKYSGDDPDITDGIEVVAKVRLSEKTVITGGEGIGIVTKQGLDQPVGEYAINTVPRKTIMQAVAEVAEEFGYDGGFDIEISVPNGEEIALKTYNPYMGIVGGISIIGTTGIVEPMSSKALVETIRTEINVLKAEGIKNLLVTLGNYGDSFVKETLNLNLENGVKCSNFIGDTVDMAVEYGFENVLIVGHIGKMVKLGSGIMNTHSAQADGRMETLVTCGVIAGAEIELLRKIPDCVTVDSALDILSESEFYQKTLEILAERIDYHLQKKVKGALKIGAVIFSYKSDFLIKTRYADEIITKMEGN